MERRTLEEKNGTGPAVPAGLKVPMSTRNIFVFKGFIKVEKAGTYEFRVPCDDACRLTVGGIVVHTSGEGGLYEAMHPKYLSRAEFFEPGIYPVEMLFYDKARVAGIVAYSNVEPKGPPRETAQARELNMLPFLAGPAASVLPR
jgi:hypothetical protein